MSQEDSASHYDLRVLPLLERTGQTSVARADVT